MVNSKWGGIRKGAGRPKTESSKKTIVIRVDENLLPIIKIIKDKYQAGEDIEALTLVTNNQVDSQAKKFKERDQEELTRYKTANLKLVQRYDAEHLELIRLQSKELSNQSTIKTLKQEIETLKHLEHDCQVLKRNGSRCTRQAKVKTKYNGIEINTCNQHSKIH